MKPKNVPVSPPSPRRARGCWVGGDGALGAGSVGTVNAQNSGPLARGPLAQSRALGVKRPGRDRPVAEEAPESGEALGGPLLASQLH